MSTKNVTFKRYDVADYLKTEEDIAHYLQAVAEEGDPALIAMALGDAVRARNLSEFARNAGITRQGLHKALSSGGNPSFATVVKIANALGLQVTFRPEGKAP